MPFSNGVFHRAANWVGGALEHVGEVLENAYEQAENGIAGLFDQPEAPPALSDAHLEARVNQLAQQILECSRDLQLLQGRQQPWVVVPKSAAMFPLVPLAPEGAAIVPIPGEAECVLVAQSQEFQEIIDRRDALQKNLVDFNKKRPRISGYRGYHHSPLELQILKTVEKGARVLKQLTNAAKDLEIDQYEKDLKNYQENPSCENATILQESIAALLKTDQVAKQHDIDLRIDMNAVKHNLDVAKQTLANQYNQDRKAFEKDPSYSHAMALRLSATPLLRTEKIGEQYHVDLQMGDMDVELYLHAAKNKMQEIRNAIEHALSELVVPSDMEFGVLEILENRTALLSGQIEEVIQIHKREIESGRPLPEEWDEIIEWKNFCLSSCSALAEELMNEQIKAMEADIAKKGIFSPLTGKLSSIIEKLQRLIALLRSLVAGNEGALAAIAARGPIDREMDALTLQISQCAKDLATLQLQAKALEKARTSPLPEAVAIMLDAGCGPVAQEMIDRRDALQNALEEFDEIIKLKQKAPGYRASALELAVENSSKMLDALNAAIDEFADFDPELQQMCKDFDAAHNNYLDMLDDFINTPLDNPLERAKNAGFLEVALRLPSYNVKRVIDGKEVVVKLPNVLHAASKLRSLQDRGYFQFRTEEAVEQDKAYLDGIILEGVSARFYREVEKYERAYDNYKKNPDYSNALALQTAAALLLEMHTVIQEKHNADIAKAIAKAHELDMGLLKQDLQAAEASLQEYAKDAQRNADAFQMQAEGWKEWNANEWEVHGEEANARAAAVKVAEAGAAPAKAFDVLSDDDWEKIDLANMTVKFDEWEAQFSDEWELL